MSYEDKAIPSRCPSPKTPIPESPRPARSIRITSGTEANHAPNPQPNALDGPVAIFWDIENCPVPIDVQPEDVAGNIRMALRVHPLVQGAVTHFSAYGDFNAFPRRLREGCQRTGVKLVDVPNGRKDAADKAILVDMFLFALDSRPPSSIVLVSGDVDFAPALHILGQRGYTVILVIPSRVDVSSALTNAGRFVWDWTSVARGEGFVPPKMTYCGANVPNEEESIVYRGISQRSQMYQKCSSTGTFIPSSRCQSLPSGLSEAPTVDQNGMQQELWVQPGDIQGLKGQLARLCEISGGALPLVRVPPEYLKSFGRPLYMAEYGVCKLVNLINKMSDTFLIVGKGYHKLLRLRDSRDRQTNKFSSPPRILINDRKGKGMLEDRNMGTSSDECSNEFDDRFDSLKQEVQELLVCYGNCPVQLSVFESLYEQRYKKSLDFESFGVDGLEELVEKARDVVALYEEEGSKKKLLHLVVNG